MRTRRFEVGLWGYDGDYGVSPQAPEFGANQYVTDTSGHSDYWNDGSRSLESQAKIIVGQYDGPDGVALEHGTAPTS